MGRARRKTIASVSSDARELLTAIAQAKKAAVCIKEIGDDDLAGAVGDFVLLYPDGRMCVVTDVFIRNACLIYLASKRFVPWKPKPKPTQADIKRADRLIDSMRDALRTRNNDAVVIPPPDWKRLVRVSEHEYA